jgi:hypothetical protein
MLSEAQIKRLAVQHESPDGCYDASYGFTSGGLIAFARAIERAAREDISRAMIDDARRALKLYLEELRGKSADDIARRFDDPAS